uniref:ABC1 atypical kinase-like domain-containing protein n=1 Tax=viral metagenome TaxID=1070528 RepID=A0A6C0EZH1_9ZZZZ
MYDFGLGYFKRLYYQIKNIYQIKKHLDIIHNSLNTNETKEQQIANFEALKQIIFSCGSLYIKFFQWYISKLKTNLQDLENSEHIENKGARGAEGLEKINLDFFINYYEDIFEQCPYHSIEHTKEIFNESMVDISLDNYVDMSTFKEIASGSIGQVYYARRKSDGLEIAIKVKHPNIERDLKNQYELIRFIKFIQSISFIKNRYNLYFNIDDFLGDINLQCDFNNEANNCKTFIENFKDSSKYIIFPKIIFQSNDLLISEYIEGESFDTLTDIQKQYTSINFVCFFYQMLLIDNFTHGDLHCKNWKVKLNKETNIIQIIVYDCGICFQNINVELTYRFWFALSKYDVDEIKKIVKEFIIHNNTNNIDVSTKKFDQNINNLFDNMLTQSMVSSFIIKSIVTFFRENNIIVHKFLLNFSILLCVVEDFLKKNSIIDKEQTDNTKKSSMFEIIKESQLDIIAFCDVKKCYPKVRDLFSLQMKDKYKNYKENIDKNNIKESTNGENRLFSSLSLSSLTFRKPE